MAKKPHQRDQAKYRLRIAEEQIKRKKRPKAERIGRIHIPKSFIEYMLKKGSTIQAIANKCNVSRQTIYNRMNTYQIRRTQHVSK